MYKLSNSKIENRAIGALSSIIDDHQTMDHQFNSMDKEMSWDGYIWIYKNGSENQDKNSFDDKVPVQIKGHIDEKGKYYNRKYITYSVSLEDLEVYFNDRGVLYFQIFMSTDGKKKEIFYASLFPTKLKYFLEKAKKKGNKKNINIPFTKMEKKATVFYCIVKQFSNESKKQGFGHEQLVQNAIKEADMSKVKEVTASVVGAANEYDFLKRLGTGDVSLYAKLDGIPFSVPLEWHEGSVYYMVRDVKKEVCIAGKKYYDSYKISSNSKGEITINPSDNIEIEMSNNKLTFKPKTDIKTLSHDAEFLICAMKNSKLTIGDWVFPYGNVNLPNELLTELQFFIDLDKLLTQINFEYSKPFPEIEESIKKKFLDILALQEGSKNHLFTEQSHIYNLIIDDRYVPLLIFRNDSGERNDIFNAIYTERYQLFVTDEKERHYRVPMFAHIKGKVMKKLYKYDAEIFAKQISNAEFNLVTEESMNMSGLNLIHAYDGDEEKNQCLLEIALDLYNKLISLFGKKNIYIINKMQIKKRQGKLEQSDVYTLSKMKCIDRAEECGRYILLENKQEAEKYFSQMLKEEQDLFKMYPIFKLYTEL